jgi:hypothetical protein
VGHAATRPPKIAWADRSPDHEKCWPDPDRYDQGQPDDSPAILGTGKTAFEETPERRNLRLKESKVAGVGVVVLIHERAA